MGKLNLTVDLDNLTEKEREEFFELVEKSKKSFNPFERVKTGNYYYVNSYNEVECNRDTNHKIDDSHFKCCHYYNDKEFAEHQALRELLNRKLIKFSYENSGADIENYDDAYSIYSDSNHVLCTNYFYPDLLSPVFISEEVAQRAIDEVVKPFMKEHPNFKWWG